MQLLNTTAEDATIRVEWPELVALSNCLNEALSEDVPARIGLQSDALGALIRELAAIVDEHSSGETGRGRPAPPAGGVLVEETGAGKFQVAVSVHGRRFVADEPADVGGLGSGPSPYELVAAGLGACTAMTVRLYAERKGWPLKRTHVAVTHGKVAGQIPADVFDRKIALEGPLDAEQTARLYEIADKCPVHRTLEGGARITTERLTAPPTLDAAAADEHFRDMDEACRNEGAPA